MRYCISDIHGEYDLFLTLLDEIKFSDDDTLIVSGDIIDKGEQSVKLANFIFSLENSICLKGNHEYDFLKKYHALASKDNADFDLILKQLQEYFPYDGHLLDWDTVDNFDAMLNYYDGGSFLCVHAGVPLDSDGKAVALDSVMTEHFVYDRTMKEPNTFVNDKKCILFGHTPTCYTGGDFRIIKYPRRPELLNSRDISDFSRIHHDTGVYLTDVLGCICIDTCECFYVKR